MKATLISLIALTGVAIADIPRKGTLQTYSVLWNNSPFTSKPPPPQPVRQSIHWMTTRSSESPPSVLEITG